MKLLKNKYLASDTTYVLAKKLNIWVKLKFCEVFDTITVALLYEFKLLYETEKLYFSALEFDGRLDLQVH